ncbi:MAG: response regulator [Pyrinomonadaceae bacterium]
MSVTQISVLLIEDNPGDVRLIQEMLVEPKYPAFNLESVDRLSEGLARLKETEFDAALLDLSLPDSSGLETFVTFHGAAKELPVVILSGLNDETTALECVNGGAQDYLIKDEVNSHLLVRSLRYAMARGLLEKERSELLARERAARTQADEANRAKDEFLAIVSHELRTPLNAMLGWSRMLAAGKLDAKTAARGVEAIERNARAQTQLIGDLLDISRITTGKLRLNARPVKLDAIITDTVDAIGPAAQAKQISLQATLDDDAGFISGDPDRLQQIAWNLLSNAIKFTPAEGRVEISVNRVGDYVQLAVTDTGEGISAEFLPLVFERFRQADSSTTRKFGGLGLGLSIVRHLVELQGGLIRVDSDGENQGARFMVMFPVLAQVEGAANPESNEPAAYCIAPDEPSLTGLRVLVVDDDTDSRAVIAEMLLQFGAEVLTASSAHEALQVVELFAPHVLLSDIEMPKEDGYSLLRKVRSRDLKQGSFIPAAALTAYGRSIDRVRALKGGFQAYLAKPVDPHELALLVARLAKGSAASTNSKP